MTSVGVQEAKTHLSRLLQRVEQGEEVAITRRGVEVARLVPPGREGRVPVFGVDEGRFTLPADFDEPLDDELLDLFRA